ncbi:MAG: STAS domain-containing protein [Nitrospinae bacterium]|nr:STAS domain-containing protein [Nitrospinota bacterium]
MRVETRESGGVIILDLFGNIRTNEDYAVFKKAVDDIIDEGKVKIVLNFKSVSFINSSGLGRLVLAAKRIKESDGVISIVNLSGDLRELFLFTRLDTKIPIFQSEQEAIAGV